jgi:membrane associated rhomboid family serine protease
VAAPAAGRSAERGHRPGDRGLSCPAIIVAVVLPVHDVNPLRRTPWLTWLLIAINVVVFLSEPVVKISLSGNASSAAAACRQEAYFDEHAVIPAEVVHGQPLRQVATGSVVRVPVARPDGTAGAGLACQAAPPRYHKNVALSVLASMFLHGSWTHLLGNMLFLLIFGNNVEDRLGRLRYLLLYLGCGAAATVGYAFANPDSTTVTIGASGAIAGVLGAYLWLFPRARVWSLLTFFFFIPVKLPAWVVLGGWFLLQYVYARGAGVANGAGVAYLAHVIGFILGFLLVLPLQRQPVPVRRRA